MRNGSKNKDAQIKEMRYRAISQSISITSGAGAAPEVDALLSF